MRYRNNWIGATVQTITETAKNVRQISLIPLTGTEDFTVGSHIDVQVIINDKPEIRSYSLIGKKIIDGTYTIAVKKLVSSRGGSKYMWDLAIGNQINISQPTNHFELSYGANQYLFIAGGIGITPLIGMAEEMMSKNIKAQMIYVGKNEDEMPYINRLKNILGKNLMLHFSDTQGTFDENQIIEFSDINTYAYLCGPIGFMNAIRKVWEESPFENSNLRFETFGASGLFAPQAFKISLPRFNKEINVSENQTILSALKDENIEVMYDCKKGECGLCQLNVIAYSGDIDHRDFILSEKQKQENKKMCICVSRVANGNLVLDTAYRES